MRKISTWLGDTKTRSRDPDFYNGKTLINIELARQMESKVKPGDIMISRTDWFLSNMFLPGFWSHSFLYIGDFPTLNKYFDSSEVNSFYLKKCRRLNYSCTNFIEFLEAKFEAFKEYKKNDKYGYPNVLIEATSEGVHFSSIRHTFLNDYLAALRPQITLLEKAKSIENAFEFFGLEYDFDFDYKTDDKLVCSELVGKSFDKSLNFNFDIDKKEYLEIVMGRVSMPVKNIAIKAFNEDNSKKRPQELKFIAYLMGQPKNKTAVFADKNTFFKTRNKKKWSFMAD